MELCDRKTPFGRKATSISRTDNTPTAWRTADRPMCSGSHRATIRREERSERPRGGPGCASDVESASAIGPELWNR
eukprot:2003372-Prymnesium_polylepis.2